MSEVRGASGFGYMLARAGLAAAIGSFFLPWIGASLAGKAGLTLTGWQLVTGAQGFDGAVAPSIPIATALLVLVACLGISLVWSVRRAGGLILGGAVLAALLIAAPVIYIAYSKAPAGLKGSELSMLWGAWLALALLVGLFLLLRAIMPADWREELPEGVRPYTEAEPLAAFALGLSSGFPFAMIGATLTTRLAQSKIDVETVTAFTLAILVYNFKWAWAWIIDGVPVPILSRLGQRVSWLIVAGVLVMAAVANLAMVDPAADIGRAAIAAILVGFAGATYDIVIDGYRIETLKPHQLGVGSGMTQYGWRIGSAGAGALALVIAARAGWEAAYLVCALLALPAMITGLVMGEPERHRPPAERRGLATVAKSIWGPFAQFFARHGAWIVFLFVLVHKVGDTLANLTFRLLFDELGFSNDEIAFYDVAVGFWAYLIGVFIGGVLYSKMGMKRSVMLSLVLMAISNLSFAGLAAAGHSNVGMAGAIGFENIASGFGGVVVIAYFSALTDLRFTASQYALISAAASIFGRLLTGTTAGALIKTLGFVDFYLLTTVIALPGVFLFWWMMRTGVVDRSIGTAGTVEAGEEAAEAK